ncbi:amino acid adenylation domain-containing protein, partial [Catenovulum sediminis]
MVSNITKIIKQLSDSGVFVFVEDGKLKTRSDKSALTADIVTLIKSHKEALLEYLSCRTLHRPVEHQTIDALQLQQGELSFAQQRLWLLDQIDGGSAHYNITGSIRLTGQLNIEALNKAFVSIVERHQSLRTCFVKNDKDQPIQVVQSEVDFAIEVHDLSTLADERKHQLLAQQTQKFSLQTYDLTKDVLLRAKILKEQHEEYLLLVSMHHIASDGWSMGILIHELSALYRAYSQAQANPLPPLAIQYIDYAHWQRNHLQKEVLEQQLKYWTEQLVDLPVEHNLPLDKARPKAQTFAGNRVYSTVSVDTLEGLKQICQKQNATLFMGLHAAFSALLARFSNETDIVIGSPVANREQAEIAPLIGFFVNTLVLRTDLAGEPGFIELLNRSKKMLLEAYANQQTPFEQIVEVLQPERNLSHSALFQIMLVLQNNEVPALTLPDLTLTIENQLNQQAKYDLTLHAEEGPDGLKLEWEYNTDLFFQQSIDNMASCFAKLLESLVASPAKNVFAVDILEPVEVQKYLFEWNDTTADYPNEHCIHQLFEQQMQRTPHAIAMKCGEHSISYQKLNEKANQLAHYLVEKGHVKPGTLVGLCIDRSIDMLVGMLGILKAGGAYVPLDPDYPVARIEHMVAFAQLGCIITKEPLAQSTFAPERNRQIICLDNPKKQTELAGYPTQNIDPTAIGLNAQQLAYVIYTSGSTGQPKGVMIAHHAAVNLIDWVNHQYSVNCADRILCVTSMCFDLSVYDLFGGLAAGACIVLADAQMAQDPSSLLQLMQTEQISFWDSVPSTFNHLVNFIEQEQPDYQLTSLRVVFMSGDWIPVSLPQRCLKYFPKVKVQSLGGATEGTVWSNVYPIEKDLSKESSIPYGKPIQNNRFYILDRYLKPVPKGVAGELYIGGVGVAEGYLNDEVKTNAAFLPDPYNPQQKNPRMYKTGDRGRLLADDNMEFLGRLDYQCKLRGYRVELGEIENALNSHPAIKDSVTMVKEQSRGTGEQMLVAYVVLSQVCAQEEKSLDFVALKQYLQSHLPHYMVPSFFEILPSLPLNTNGKIDRKALPEPDFSQKNGYQEPVSQNEKRLAGIWQAILKLDRVGATDNFFELGGHSLLLTQVISKLQKINIHVTARDIFTLPVLSDLAKKIDEASDYEIFEAPENRIPEVCNQITPDMLPLIQLSHEEIEKISFQVEGGVENIQDIYPLGPLQEGILFNHRVNTNRDPYILPSLLKINNQDTLQNLIDGLQQIIKRHDVLRTAIIWQGISQPVQVVCRTAELAISWLSIDNKQDALTKMQHMCAVQQAKFDLSKPPLLTLQIAEQQGTSEFYVLMRYHHIISDHQGLEVIQKELAAYQRGSFAQLSAPVPYREFIAQGLHQAKRNNAKVYFTQMLSDIEEACTPFNLTDVQGDGSRIIEVRKAVPHDLAQQLRDLSQTLNTSPAILFHSAWALVVAACSGRDDVVFGTVLSGRLQGTSGAEDMLGVLINTLPIRVKIGQMSAQALIAQVQNALQDLLPYEQTQLSEVQQCSGLANGVPLFSAIFNYRHSLSFESADQANSGIEFLNGQERTNYPFSLSVDDLGQAFELEIQVDASINAERVLGYMQSALSQLVFALQ